MIITSMIIEIIAPHIAPLILILLLNCMRCCDRGCKRDKRRTKKLLQSSYEWLYIGPEFILDNRLAQIVCLTWVSFQFSSRLQSKGVLREAPGGSEEPLGTCPGMLGPFDNHPDSFGCDFDILSSLLPHSSRDRRSCSIATRLGWVSFSSPRFRVQGIHRITLPAELSPSI